MSNRVKYYLINSTTTQRSADGYWRWINPVNYQNSIDYKNVSVVQIAITLSHYNFKDETFIFTEDDGATNETQLTVNIPDGNYSQTQLASTLKALMDAESNSNGNNYVYTVSYNSISDAFTISVSANTFSIDNGTVNDMIGFESTAQDDSHTSTRYTNMNRYGNFYLKSELGSQDLYSTMSGRPSSSICVIPLKGNSGDLVHIEYPNPVRIKTASNFDQLTFRLETLDNQQVDLRGGYWTAVLKVEY